MNHTEKSDKRVSAKWKLCIIVICTAFVFLYLTVKLTEHIRKDDTQGQVEGGEMRKLYVQKEGEAIIYTSTDGAVTWSDEGNPGFYMQMPEEKLTDSVTSIPIEIVNASDYDLTAGEAYWLYAWSDGKWVSIKFDFNDNFVFNDIGYSIYPHTSYEMACKLLNTRLKVGKYLVTKTVIRDNDRSIWTLSTEFTVE